MKRLAAHYVLLPDDRLLKQHYVELDDENRLLGVFPLNKEIANTIFYNGILIIHLPPAPSQGGGDAEETRDATLWKERNTLRLPLLGRGPGGGEKVEIYLLTHIHLLPPKFTASDCRSHSHIQRLG